jgi:amino acid transporter
MWTFTGFDASAHVSEETRDPARRAPWGIVSAVGVSAVFGYALVLALTLAIRDLPATVAAKVPALFVLRAAVGERWGVAAMGLAVLAMWFCGLSSVTSASRTLFAFARDGGVPGSSVFGRVHPKTKTPLFAIAAATCIPLALGGASAKLTDDQFLAVASLATTALYISYAIPIVLGAVARHRGRWTALGPFSLGRAGLPVAWLAAAWAVFVLAAFGVPHRGVFLGLVGGVAFALAVLYVVLVRGRFAGPRMTLAGLGQGSQN